MDHLQNIPSDTRTRIIEAAEMLYEQAGRESLPTTADVRRVARTDMNTTNTVMREWKRQLTARPAPVTVIVPDAVQQAMTGALSTVWSTATEMANASLRAAETAWDSERQELLESERSLGSDYERLETELGESRRITKEALERAAELETLLAESQAVAGQHAQRAAQSDARSNELASRVEDLKAELRIAHDDIAAVRLELTEARRIHADEINELRKAWTAELDRVNEQLGTVRGRLESSNEQLAERTVEVQRLVTELATVTANADAATKIHSEQKQAAGREANRLAERFTSLQGERDTAVSDAAQARAEAAKYAGRVEAMQEQIAGLLSRLGGPVNPS